MVTLAEEDGAVEFAQLTTGNARCPVDACNSLFQKTWNPYTAILNIFLFLSVLRLSENNERCQPPFPWLVACVPFFPMPRLTSGGPVLAEPREPPFSGHEWYKQAGISSVSFLSLGIIIALRAF